MVQKNSILGLSLITFGGILLLAKIGVLTFGWNTLWPLVILIPGLIFELSFLFNRYITGILVPGGILTIVGLTFLICANFGWNLMFYLWPMFPLSVAFGLFQFYIFDSRDRALLIPISILSGVSIIGFFSTIATTLVNGIIPFVIIILGIYFIYKGWQQK